MPYHQTPAWRLIEQAAIDLTQAGHTPFSPKDLVAQVQAADPSFTRNSINPVIQSITEGRGDLGEGGYAILRRIGRGRYELGSGARSATPSMPRHTDLQTDTQQEFAGYNFRYVADLVPEQRVDGSPRELYPHERYSNNRGLALHAHGRGPFCAFSLTIEEQRAGIILIEVDSTICHVSHCEDLAHRINVDYGTITPRNCYRGGPETHCRINHAILSAAKDNSRCKLWFRDAPNEDAEDAALAEQLEPVWDQPPSRVG